MVESGSDSGSRLSGIVSIFTQMVNVPGYVLILLLFIGILVGVIL